MIKNQFHDKLRTLMDEYAHFTYSVTKKFPKDEVYGVSSQMRRSALSVILNYIEGYSRKKPMVLINFLEISYGSLKESKYLFNFSFKEKYLSEREYLKGDDLTEEIGAMLWSTLKSLKRDN